MFSMRYDVVNVYKNNNTHQLRLHTKIYIYIFFGSRNRKTSRVSLWAWGSCFGSPLNWIPLLLDISTFCIVKRQTLCTHFLCKYSRTHDLGMRLEDSQEYIYYIYVVIEAMCDAHDNAVAGDEMKPKWKIQRNNNKNLNKWMK